MQQAHHAQGDALTLNAALVGRTYPPTSPYVVGREKVREFAAAVREPDPVCHDLAAVRQHIPQTLLIKNSGCVLGASTELIHQQPHTQVA